MSLQLLSTQATLSAKAQAPPTHFVDSRLIYCMLTAHTLSDQRHAYPGHPIFMLAKAKRTMRLFA